MKFIHQIDPSKFTFFKFQNCPDTYMESSERIHLFEMIWFRDDSNSINNSHCIYLIPLYRCEKINFEGKKGCVIAFKRDYLEEDNKEFALDVFNLFNIHGQYTNLHLSEDVVEILQYLSILIEKEYQHSMGSYLVLKSLLKVFLLNLIRASQHYFLNQDIHQKRVYQFIMLMDEHYKIERKAKFYASKIGVSEKRINQILKDKMNKTLTQLLHDRVVVEADRMLISGELTIKEIAFDLHFDDPAYFSRFYKKQTGHTPEEFKKRNVCL
ncbi:Arabinose operon regulatory protein [Chryseobacterium nakagawai]|uniref:Helix-turn-helix domain-containing protein n=1 Tax=Chryseobacterium nakagawai TaxID=1241982 RepID=A0AAD0YRP0_CHRNA|nr:helix-turn-helix domain-containing protein [Chryseobacterium nakagawai]AZA93519.1 helix-turn-helix domain-containing protein [Chryseobacterium nakagawai]VEH20208.1 Arabinose operon regulatory protein [Chryseobacterium nakagawai]